MKYEIRDTMRIFHDKCVELVENKAKELNYDLKYRKLEFIVCCGFLGLKSFKFQYKNEGNNRYSVIGVERECEWWACGYSFDNIGIATEENIKLVCKYGDDILKNIPLAVEMVILDKQAKVKKNNDRIRKLESYCNKKIKEFL